MVGFMLIARIVLAKVAVPLAASVAALFVAAVADAADQPSSPEGQVIVSGEGSVSVPPDYAQIRSGVTTRAKSVSEAVNANSKLMAAITATLLDAGIAQKDIQTSRVSVQPVYAQPQPGTERKLSGYSVTNQVTVAVRQIDKLGDILDRLVTAGANDIGNLSFVVADPSKALDQAREAAVADARRKAEIYARASGVTLGRVAWITEGGAYAPPVPMARMHAAAPAEPVPISAGEETFHVQITIGFDIAH
jgi:uncharacterized protein YggE